MSAPDTILLLGDFAFKASEIPEVMPWGGDQNITTHELVGGRRVLDAMGRSDRPLEWHGIFFGADATDRARQVDAIRILGLPVVVSWDRFSYVVIVKSFHPDFSRYYQIPYSIVCEVQEDQNSPTIPSSALNVDDVVANDLASADGIVGQLNTISADVAVAMAPITAAVAAVHAAVSVVSSIATAANSVVQSILTPVAALRTQIAALTSSVGNAIENVGSVGGVFPGSTVAQSIAAFNGQIAGMQQQTLLVQLDGVVGRVQMNVSNTQVDSGTVTQAGGNLFNIASQQYGDATKWADLARVNSIADPALVGVNTIKIPKNTGDSGGIYSG